MEPSITSSRQLEFTIAFTSLCMAFQFAYLALLLKVMTKEGAIRKKAVNVMILTDEGIKLLASIGTLIGAILSSIWAEMSQLGGSNFIGNSSICQLYITLSFCAFWSVIGSAGIVYSEIEEVPKEREYCCNTIIFQELLSSGF